MGCGFFPPSPLAGLGAPHPAMCRKTRHRKSFSFQKIAHSFIFRIL